MIRSCIMFICIVTFPFGGAFAASSGYPGLRCENKIVENLSVISIQADNYNGYNYLEFKDDKGTKYGGFIYYGGGSYNTYVQEATRIATMAYLLGLKVNICLYESSVYSTSVRAVELKT